MVLSREQSNHECFGMDVTSRPSAISAPGGASLSQAAAELRCRCPGELHRKALEEGAGGAARAPGAPVGCRLKGTFYLKGEHERRKGETLMRPRRPGCPVRHVRALGDGS